MTEPTASPEYAFERLAQALRTAVRGEGATAQRAVAKARRWQAVIEGMASGALQIGSRTPTAFPAWVTLEVVHGGFVTGKALAAGPLADDEVAVLRALGQPIDHTARARLNRYFASDAGQQRLLAALDTQRLIVDLPEHGALPVLAWLIEEGHAADAAAVFEAIEPYFDTLRFYPAIVETPRHVGTLVRRASVGEVADALRARRTPRAVRTMNEALTIWASLYDRLVALWSDTVEGAPPTLRDDTVIGGWPCRRWPEDWVTRRAAWLADYAAADARALGGKHRHPKSNFCRLREALQRCPVDSAALNGRAVGWIRRALANTHARHGVVGSAPRTRLRATQAAHAARPTQVMLATVIADRLQPWPRDGGLPTLDGFDHPVRANEDPLIDAGAALPAHLTARVRMAYEAPLAELVAEGIVTSAELLATFVPQISARQRSAGFDASGVRALYEAIYTAFRRRRSVLLLDLSSQVRVEELPWFAALHAQRRQGAKARQLAREAMVELTLLYLTRFAHTLLPNPLIVELGGLAAIAELKLPLCAELAADLFRGSFSKTWTVAAKDTVRLLAGSVYARYYDLPERVPGQLVRWCTARAGDVGPGARWGSHAARAGAIIEQGQIVTSHNLASIVQRLEIGPTVAPLAPDLAQRVLGWALEQLASLPADRRGQLLGIKNTAYAWRQGVFLLSLLEPSEARAIVAALRGRVVGATAGEAYRGLRHVLDGGRFDAQGRAPGGRRLLGWCAGRHWAMPSRR